MSRVAELLRSRRLPQVAVLALMSVGFAGCSADMQTRFPTVRSPIPLPRSRKPPVRCVRPPLNAASCRNIPARRCRLRRNSSRRRCRRLPPRRRPIRPVRPGCREGGAGSRPMRRRPIRRSRPPPRCRRARSRPRDRQHHRPRITAARSSSAPATRSTVWRSATTFRRLRSCRPMATRARACFHPASN